MSHHNAAVHNCSTNRSTFSYWCVNVLYEPFYFSENMFTFVTCISEIPKFMLPFPLTAA